MTFDGVLFNTGGLEIYWISRVVIVDKGQNGTYITWNCKTAYFENPDTVISNLCTIPVFVSFLRLGERKVSTHIV